MKVKGFLKKNWWIIALIIIFLFSFYIRSVNIVEDRILSYDPTFQYRFTKYIADWGFLPEWDELTYYVGRPVGVAVGPLMLYMTSILFWILGPLGFSLLTTCAYASAIYGAAICIPAFLLGREISNKYGGLLAAFLIGTAPQILIRTFGSSYDTDQLALFFIVLTLYLTIYALRKRNVGSFCLALLGFVAFMLAWGLFVYSFAIVAIYVVVYLILSTLFGKKEQIKDKIEIKPSIKEKFKGAFQEFKKNFAIMIALFAGIVGIGYILKADAIASIQSIIGFAGKAEAWIVNISIAELQPFNIFNIDGWIMATGRFTTGQQEVDTALFLIFVGLMTFALYSTYKKDLNKTSFLLTLLIIGTYTTFRGIRFTEFTSALFIILIAAGFGYFVEYCKKDNFLKLFSLGLGLCIVFIGAGLGMQVGYQLGPDINANWDNAWEFLRTETPELSIVGTWWDPGHMIAALAERRNYADGAHCAETCMYNINDRIVDLGKIMSTTNEAESLQLIKKYQGTSPKVYWIASDDLISKFQWLQYFGTGCDARTDTSCPLYTQIARSDIKYTESGQPGALYYEDVVIALGNVPVPILIQNKEGIVIQEIIFYDASGNVQRYDFSDSEMVEAVKVLESVLEVTIRDELVPITVWIPQHYGYITIIPPNLRNSVFTKMFFLDGIGLECFDLVYGNPQVKIFEIDTKCET